MNESIATTSNKASNVIQVPEYYYAVDINYLTHMIGKLLLYSDS